MSILVVWVNHLINLTVQFIISKAKESKKLKTKKNKAKNEKGKK